MLLPNVAAATAQGYIELPHNPDNLSAPVSPFLSSISGHATLRFYARLYRLQTRCLGGRPLYQLGATLSLHVMKSVSGTDGKVGLASCLIRLMFALDFFPRQQRASQSEP